MPTHTPAAHPVQTPAPSADLFELALNTLAADHLREHQRLMARAPEFARIEITLAVLRANGVEIAAKDIQTAHGTGTSGDLIVLADIPQHCRPRLQQLLKGGVVDMDMVAGHDRGHSALRHDNGWLLFVQWVETNPEAVAEAMQVAA